MRESVLHLRPGWTNPNNSAVPTGGTRPRFQTGGFVHLRNGETYIMNRHTKRRFRSALLGLASLALLLAPAAFAQGECSELDGIEHCALGKASLECDGGLCIIENYGGKVDGGVAANFSEGLSWSSDLAIVENDGGDSRLTASARSEGGVASTLTLRRDEEGALAISSTFTGGVRGRTYSVLVYNGGVLQGGSGGVGDGAEWIFIDPRWDEDFIMWLISLMGFTQRIHDGGCGWVLDLDETRELRLASGEVLEGDQIQLMEEVKGESHYAYTGFDGIDLVGNIQTLTLESATVLP